MNRRETGLPSPPRRPQSQPAWCARSAGWQAWMTQLSHPEPPERASSPPAQHLICSPEDWTAELPRDETEGVSGGWGEMSVLYLLLGESLSSYQERVVVLVLLWVLYMLFFFFCYHSTCSPNPAHEELKVLRCLGGLRRFLLLSDSGPPRPRLRPLVLPV